MKTSEEINQYIHEARGLCWHEIIPAKDHLDECEHPDCMFVCTKCEKGFFRASVAIIYLRDNHGVVISYRVGALPTYLTHNPAWTEMFNWLIDQDWFSEFKDFIWSDTESLHAHLVPEAFPFYLFANPPMLATKIVEFLEERNVGN